MSPRISSPTFIGRQSELERLDAALQAAAAGRPSLVLVAGDAGVGKSRLLAEFSTRAQANGTRILLGGCLDIGQSGLPFAPFAEALKGLVNALEREAEATTEAVFGSSARVLAGLVPNLRRLTTADIAPTDPADPAARQARLFDAVIDVLGRLSAMAPVLLILEDLHWADGSTRDLLRFLLRNIRQERLLLIGTFRGDDLHRRHPLMPLLSELERSDRVHRLDVRPFDRDEIVEQLAAILGDHPPASVVDGVAERSDGLPFYVEELMAGDPAAGRITGSLRDILDLRLASLSDGSLVLARAAAVIGRPFALEQLAAVADLDEIELMSALRGLIEERVLVSTGVRDGPTYAFRHALLREAAYDDLLPTERIRIHTRLADRLAAGLDAGPSDELTLLAGLAIHTYHAGDQPRALTAAVHAVRALADAGAYREALEHAERALELWSRTEDPEALGGITHGELRATAGRMAANSGRPGPALAHTQGALRELETWAPPERLAELLLDTYAVAFEAEAFEIAWDAARRLRGLVDRLEPSRLQVLALIVIGDERWSTGHLQQARVLGERSMVTARTLNDDRLWALAASEHASELATSGRVGRAEALVDAALAIEAGFDGSERRFMAAVGACWVLWHAGRFEDSAQLAADARRATIRYGVEQRYGAWYLGNEAHAMLQLGRLEEAEALARSAVEHRFLGMWAVLSKIEAIRGRLGDGRTTLPMTDLWNSPLWRMEAEAFLQRAVGDFDRLRAVVNEAEAERARTDLISAVWLLLGTAVGAAADQAVVAGQRRRGADVIAARRLGKRWLTELRAIVHAGRADGGAGAFAEATLATAEAEARRAASVPDPAAWRNAAAAWHTLSHPYGTAYAEFRLAEALLEANGDRSEVASILRGAHAAATALGAVPLRVQIETVAGHARIGLTSVPGDLAPPSPGDQADEVAASPLTPRERDVLRLVAGGHTNREIGDRLFISEKTVSVHVSNGMRKLDALSRYEAAAAARGRGYLD